MKNLAIIVCLWSVSLFSQNSPIDTILPTKQLDTIQQNPLFEDVTDTIQSINNIPDSEINEMVEVVSDTIQPETETLYSNYDLEQIDSLLVAGKFNSPLVNETKYVIDDSQIITNIEHIVSADLLKQRLTEISATTPFHLAYNPALEKVINNYVKYRRKHYAPLMARAKYYFPIFEEYLDKYDIPLEMKYLAIVESGLHPKIKSRVGATGLWQFMYGTGTQFKLDINSYVDERQDPIKSTEAACKYLKMLYNTFKDWDLALAAYNSGPGNVLKAIKRSGGHKNYWNIRPYLPYETAGYVPAFYATMYIFKYADELDIYPDKPDYYYFETDTIQVKQTISFKHISEKTGVSEEVLELLNPKYRMNIVPYAPNKEFSVRLPRNKTIEFLDKEQEIYALATYDASKREKPLEKYVSANANRIRYRVKSGDFLGKIAKKFGVKVKQIKRWNNMRSSRLKIGQRLYIYPRRM